MLLAHSIRENGERYGARFAEQCSKIELAQTQRLLAMVTPASRGTVLQQAREIASVLRNVLASGKQKLLPTVQTVFMAHGSVRPVCEQVFQEAFEEELPMTTFVVQPPCSGAALAVELWGIGGPSVSIQRNSPEVLCVDHDGLHWIHSSTSMMGSAHLFQSELQRSGTTYLAARQCFDRSAARLGGAGANFREVVRAWFYVGGINERDGTNDRYTEFNRARNSFYDDQRLVMSGANGARTGGFPASTGIGMDGDAITINCLALQTKRADVKLVTLENPAQTPAYAYGNKYAIHAPRFSRGMAMVAGRYLTIWVSGTASICNAETLYAGDAAKQTKQTLENIRSLLGANNFEQHGLSGAGATLRDLARVRVYLKRIQDYPACKRVCEEILGDVPAIYVKADICRPELLVEIEGVAFSEVT